MAFEEDCANGALPAVSWLFPTSVASEHPAFLAAAGAQFVASNIEALAANEDLWNSTVFILKLRRERRLLRPRPADHTPQGHGGRVHDPELTGRHPGRRGSTWDLGSGFRMPAIVVSPLSVGGFVCSDPLDHTSALHFIERVTGISEPNIILPAFPGALQTPPKQQAGHRPSAG
jgi:phospholipase C